MIEGKDTKKFICISSFLAILTGPVPASIPEEIKVNEQVNLLGAAEPIYPRYAQVTAVQIDEPATTIVVNSGSDDTAPSPPLDPPVTANEARTTEIVNRLEQFQRLCEGTTSEYKVDCFARAYREIAKEISTDGDYSEARQVLLDTANKLDTLVRRNLDRQKPSVRARMSLENGQTVTTPPIRAIQEQRMPQLNQQASEIIAEAETILLRSASSDSSRAIHFQRIAAAVGSNKVLLRSG